MGMGAQDARLSARFGWWWNAAMCGAPVLEPTPKHSVLFLGLLWTSLYLVRYFNLGQVGRRMHIIARSRDVATRVRHANQWGAVLTTAPASP